MASHTSLALLQDHDTGNTILARSLHCIFKIHAWGAQANAKGSLWCILRAFEVVLTAVHGRLRGMVLQILHNIVHDPHQDPCTDLHIFLILIGMA